MTLTERQQQIFDFIVTYRRDNGCSPSIPEIQRHFGIRSPNGVAGHLQALETKGVIRRAERGSRRIDVVGEQREAGEAEGLHRLPVVGSIQAGLPQAVDGAAAESTAVFDEALLGFHPREGCFVLKVRGESMKDAGILSGDMVVVDPKTEPAAGQIVAALIDGECTLKRLVRMGGAWFLKAENAAFPELYPRADLSVQGVVRTVVRRVN